MRTHKEGNSACDVSINYFQTHKLEHLYKEDALFIFVKAMVTSAHSGAQVLLEHIEIPRVYLLSSFYYRIKVD